MKKTMIVMMCIALLFVIGCSENQETTVDHIISADISAEEEAKIQADRKRILGGSYGDGSKAKQWGVEGVVE